MFEGITAILIMAGIGILQSAVLSRMPMLLGTADLILLFLTAWVVQDRVRFPWIWGVMSGLVATIISGLPVGILFSAYLVVTGIAYVTRRRIWKAPLLTMMAVTMVGTFVVYGFNVLGVLLMGVFIDLAEAFNLIVLPGLMLNLLLAVPVFVFVREMARWLYPGDASLPSDGEV